MRLEDALQSAKSAHHRIDRVEQEISDLQALTEAVAVTANNVERLQTDVTEMKKDIKADILQTQAAVRQLADVPSERWNAVVGYVMAALVSGIVGTVLGVVLR